MAMNKSEQAEMKALRMEAEMAKALSWPNFPKPIPLESPSHENGLEEVVGWEINTHSRTIQKIWNGRVSHYSSPERRNGSQGHARLYATEREAWLALFHELANLYAFNLAEVLAKANA